MTVVVVGSSSPLRAILAGVALTAATRFVRFKRLRIVAEMRRVQDFPPHGHHFGGNQNKHGQLGPTIGGLKQEP